MKKDVYELTNPQKSIWLTEEFYKGTAINNICGNLIIREKVDFEKFKKAINLFVKTNQSFRLKFFVEDSIPKQYVSEFTEFEMEEFDVASEDDLLILQKETASEVFDVIDSLLFKFKIVKLPDGSGGFIVNAHHLISDAATFAIIATEIVKIYSVLINNTEFEYNTNLYTDYIKSEQEYLQSEKFKKDEAYWNELYKEVPEVATVPSLLNKNETSSNDSLREDFIIPEELFAKINTVCKENRISSYNLFMAIYAIYLGRVSNLDEFVIGTPILNRTNFAEKNTSGMFISTAPFKISLNHEISFADFAKKIATDSLSMLRHQKYPYQFLLENLRKQGSHVPNLYDFMFSYQITKATDKNLEVPYTTHWTGNNKIANSLEVHAHDNDSNGTVTIGYDYKTEKYTKEDILNLHNRILCLLEQITNNPSISLKDIEIVTPEEKHKILYEFNDTKVDYPKDKTIVQLFEEQVEKTPDNIAVVFEDQKLTYRELNEKANQLAWYLKEQNLSTENVVALFLDKSLEMIISILAVLKNGLAFLPIDINYPTDRINYMLQNSDTKLILTTSNLLNNCNFDIKTISADLANNDIYNPSNKFEYNTQFSSNNLAYIMYTSGSTGNPKGVMVEQKSIIRLVKNTNYIRFNSNEKILQTGSIVFDACTFEIWAALLNGFELYLIKKETLLNSSLLQDYLIKNKISTLWLTSPLFNQLVEENPHMFSGVKHLLTGGDVLSPKHINMAKTANPNLTIINGYGPTENTTFSTCFTIDKQYFKSIPIGTPIANSTCYIVSKSGNLQPIGVPGELWTGGDGVARGYLNNPKLTQEKFINFNLTDDFIYKTGDLVKWLPDGNIEFLGRIDSQIKLRGFRIELSEINKTILKNPQIKDSATIVTTVNNEKTICSYIVSNEQVDITVLQNFLRQNLPVYMIPSYIVQLDKLPINTNGKIDKNALPMPKEISNSPKKIVLFRNDIDKKLINILKSLLKVDNISIADSLLSIGIDSLNSIRLIAQIYNIYGINLSVKNILSGITVEELSDIISTAQTSNIETISQINIMDFYPTSSAQKRIYYSSKIADNSTTYNIPGGLVLSELPDIEKLEKCFNTLIERHESLRTYFEVIGGEVVQKTKEKVNFKIDFDDKICTDKYSAFIDFVKPFDLSKAPLLRVKLVKLNNKKALLLFDMHHIISDGASMQILINELCKLYNKESLSPLEITYKDYSVWEQNNLKENKFKQSEKFWVNQFTDDLPVLNLPTNTPRPTVQSFEGSNIYKKIDRNLTKELTELAKKLNITPYMLLLSCYYILLYKYTSNEDIIVGTPIIGRDNSQTHDIIGMFVNSLPLRKKLNSNETFLEFVSNVKELCLSSFEHQTYPFDELVNKLNIKRDSSRNPLFDTMFIYQNEGNKKVNLGNIKSKYYIPDSNTSKFDLSLEVVPENNKLNLRFEYASKLFNKDFIEYLSTHYINILKTVLENQDIKIEDIEMLTEKEKEKILYKFNNTKTHYSKNKTIVNLFEEQAKKAPNNIAVVFEEQKLTYKELNEKSNNIANYLITKKIEQNDIVGILLPRSIDLIISILGILKAGAGYMLIDPNLPNERINYMLKNANTKVLLTYKNLKNIKYNTIYLDNLELTNTKNLNLKLSNGNNLAVIYTSGSTGEPKGVLLKQRGAVNLIHSFIKEMKINKFKNFLSIAAVSFDMFTVETFCSILLGKTLILTNEEEQKDPYKLGLLGEKYPIDFLITTPSRMDLFLSQEKSKNMIANLKAFQLGGEVFSTTLYEKLSKVTSATMHNGYGPTEITACCSNKKIRNSNEITIGKPLNNTNILILDKDNNLCPIGVPGELCVLGDGVSKGYINNNEATSKVFLKTKYYNKIAYKTGDIAKFNKNGELVYIGRNDNQIKIRGLRIELSEIENKILDIDKIEKCAVIYKKEHKNPYIIAFFTASKTLETTDIRKELSKTIPTYMIPKYIIQIDKMPITQNGKINTKELANREIDSLDTNYIAPKTEKQKLFCKILEALLNVKVGIADDLFELGLDSLLAIKLKVELLNNNIDIDYADIFKYHTIKELCDEKSNEINITPLNNYNYDGINKILSKNVFRNNINIETNLNNNILLLGATGFVGVHILKSFIEKDKGNVYCIVRDKNNNSAKERFLSTLHFYFGKKLDKYIDKRIFVLKGDLLKENFGLSNSNIDMLKENIQIVINSAANVKHYGNVEKFNTINIGLAQNLIEFCKNNNKRLIHLSSLSISGNMVLDGTNNKNVAKNKLDFTERDLYIGQALDNVYTRSKFEAERLILDNINQELNAIILRLGNITNRYSDGAFQINPDENAFLTRVSSIINIGAIPNSILKDYIEFTPVDLCADAIVTIMQNYVKNHSVFHIYDYNHVYMDSLVELLKNCRININTLSDEEFSNLLTILLKDTNKKKHVSGIINDLSSDKKLSYEGNVNIKSNFSIQFLEKIGFIWPKIDENYIIKYVKYLRKNKYI